MRSEVLNSVRTDESNTQSPNLKEQAQELRTKVETYLRDTNKEELNIFDRALPVNRCLIAGYNSEIDLNLKFGGHL